jgi:hypothetical protein
MGAAPPGAGSTGEPAARVIQAGKTIEAPVPIPGALPGQGDAASAGTRGGSASSPGERAGDGTEGTVATGKRQLGEGILVAGKLRGMAAPKR